MRRAVLMIGAIALFVPSAAQASSIDHLAYTAGPGEENHVTVSYDNDTGLFRFEDTGVAAIGSSGTSGCSVTGNVAYCPMDWGGQVVVRLGDRNDSAVLTTQLPHVLTASNLYSGHIQMIGGAGNDSLDASPERPFDGSFYTSGGASLWGDGYRNDRVDPIGADDGNDVLIGGAGEDGFLGGGGDDVEIGGGGPDFFDGSPFITGSGGIDVYSGGSDSMYGGAGSDVFNGVESSAPNASDTISCGDGEEGPLSSGFLPNQDLKVPGDTVAFGQGDVVGTDCETVAAGIECPKTADAPCVGTTQLSGNASAGGNASASAAGRAAEKRGRKLVIGSRGFRVPPGHLIAVRVGLRPKRVSSLLSRRERARVNQTAIARSGKKRLKLRGKRFVLRRP